MRIAAQAVLYAAFVAVIGYFSTSPAYVHLAPGEAVVKLSLSHAGERKEPCRTRSEAELAKLAPNMRSPTVCTRERVPVRIVVAIDGTTIFDVVAQPTGLAKDGASTVYRRLTVAAGRHRIRAELADAPGGRMTYSATTEVDLAPGRLLVIDFAPEAGGFVFRS
jgi:hypothetical protein